MQQVVYVPIIAESPCVDSDTLDGSTIKPGKQNPLYIPQPIQVDVQ